MIELIKAYVPEAKYLSYAEALELAKKRDDQAAEQLAISCEDLGLESRCEQS